MLASAGATRSAVAEALRVRTTGSGRAVQVNMWASDLLARPDIPFGAVGAIATLVELACDVALGAFGRQAGPVASLMVRLARPPLTGTAAALAYLPEAWRPGEGVVCAVVDASNRLLAVGEAQPGGRL